MLLLYPGHDVHCHVSCAKQTDIQVYYGWGCWEQAYTWHHLRRTVAHEAPQQSQSVTRCMLRAQLVCTTCRPAISKSRQLQPANRHSCLLGCRKHSATAARPYVHKSSSSSSSCYPLSHSINCTKAVVLNNSHIQNSWSVLHSSNWELPRRHRATAGVLACTVF
jgi:hypothetical protein